VLFALSPPARSSFASNVAAGANGEGGWHFITPAVECLSAYAMAPTEFIDREAIGLVNAYLLGLGH
jgi:hypothetical protein